MWNMRCVAVQVIIGVTGRVTEGLRKHLEAITGERSVVQVQKTAVLGT